MRKSGDQSIWEKDILPNQYEPLNKDITCDVLIIGGGVTGALSAYLFNEKGINSIVIEKDVVAGGSTKSSTAILQYEIDSDLHRLSTLIDQKDAEIAFKLTLDSLYKLEDIINHLDDDCEFIRRPSLYYTNKKDQVEYMVKEYETRKEQNYDVELIDDHNDKYAFSLCSGIISYNSGATVNPVKLTNELFKHLYQNYDYEVYEQTEAKEFNLEDDYVEVKTSTNHVIRCKKIVMACGYDSLQFFDDKFYNISRSFSIATKQVNDFEGWFGKSIIRNDENPYLYLRTSKDNRIIIGGEDIEITDFNSDYEAVELPDHHPLANYKYNILEKKLNEMFPQIDNKEIEYKFNGIFIDTNDGLPFIGETPDYPNIYFNLDIGSNGILYGLLGADLLSNLYLNKQEELLRIFRFGR